MYDLSFYLKYWMIVLFTEKEKPGVCLDQVNFIIICDTPMEMLNKYLIILK